MLRSLGWVFLLGAVVAFVLSAFAPVLGSIGSVLGVILAFVVSPVLAGVGVVLLWRRRGKF